VSCAARGSERQLPELWSLSAGALLERYRRRDLSPVEVCQATLDRISARDASINAFVTVTAERALADAKKAEQAWQRGDAGALCGVPYTLKDLTSTRGVPTGRGSLVWRDASPTIDAVIAERLRDAGGVLLGKTTTPELGWKGDSGNRLNGPCHNPWRPGRTAGGSSGGAAAAAAAGFGPLHQGSDGAGSIRIPAAFCGVVGLKPTFGLVAQYPPSALELLSHLGPITRSVSDAALMLDVISGRDDRDRTSVIAPGGYHDALREPLAPLRIAFSADLGFAAVEPAVVEQARRAVAALADQGHQVHDVDLALDDPFGFVDAIWSTSMAALHRGRLDAVRRLLDPGLVRVIDAGLAYTGADLASAIQGRAVWVETLRERTAGYDLLVCPTVPCVAFATGQDAPDSVAGVNVSYLGWTPFTYPFNLSGQPAVTVPCGLVDGLPVGLQLVGAGFADALVLRAAAAYESVSAFPTLDPR
jgi:aspartyl-tRNA(Asn)/glutamyl-tRNA(Gln) amidotransferase subunit A